MQKAFAQQKKFIVIALAAAAFSSPALAETAPVDPKELTGIFGCLFLLPRQPVNGMTESVLTGVAWNCKLEPSL